MIPNDSHLRFSIRECRKRVLVGTVNPISTPTAGDLQGQPNDNVWGHLWYRLKKLDYESCQLPDPAGSASKPAGW